MSDYPWWVQDRIREAITGKAEKHEVHAVDSKVDSLERSLREARSDISSLRNSVEILQASVLQLSQELIEEMQRRTP